MKKTVLSVLTLALSLTACMPSTTTASTPATTPPAVSTPAASSATPAAPAATTPTTPAAPAAPAARTRVFKGTLSPANEIPAVTSSAAGEVTLTLNLDTKQAVVAGTVTGLSGIPTMAHIHGPAAKTANAGVLKPLEITVPVTGITQGGAFNVVRTVTLTDAEIEQLSAGLWYVNIHTAANPGGEVRAQLE